MQFLKIILPFVFFLFLYITKQCIYMFQKHFLWNCFHKFTPHFWKQLLKMITFKTMLQLKVLFFHSFYILLINRIPYFLGIHFISFGFFCLNKKIKVKSQSILYLKDVKVFLLADNKCFMSVFFLIFMISFIIWTYVFSNNKIFSIL